MDYNNFSEEIMRLRYSWAKENGEKESWDDIAERVVTMFDGYDIPNSYKTKILKAIKDRKFIPGGRFLAQVGRDYHQTSNCYHKDSPVVLERGVLPIQDVKIGDRVLTEDGTFQTVVNKFSQGYRNKLLFVKVDRMPDVLKITHDHKILTKRGWVRADELKDNDYVKVPGYKDNIEVPNKINILDYVNDNRRYEIINDKIYKLNNTGKRGKYHKQFKSINSSFDVDNDLAKFLGYYITEGCSEKNGYRVLLTFSADEKEYIKESVYLFKKIFDLDARIIDYDTWYQVEVSSAILNNFLKNFIGDKFSNKKLPYWILNTNKEFKETILAYTCRGDGHTSIITGSTSLTMCNKSSMMQLFFIAQDLGLAYSFKYQNKVKKPTHTAAVTLNIASSAAESENFVNFSKLTNKFVPNNERYWRKIVSVTEIEYNDFVWDISVDTNHSLQIAGMVGANCYLLKAMDSREGWGELMDKATRMLMSGGGLGVDYSDIRSSGSKLKRTGGTSSGPIPLMKTLNEVGRGVMSGGSRRSAIWAGLRWNHPDIFDFITLKDWPEYINNQKSIDFNTPAPMDMTNISVILDKDFFDAFENPSDNLHKHAQRIYWETVEHMVKTSEPGFSIDYDNKNESLRNAPIHPNTHVCTIDGYKKVGDIIDKKIIIWTGKQWAETIFRKTKENVPVIKVKMTGDRSIICDAEHEFILDDGIRIPAKSLHKGNGLLVSLPMQNINKYDWCDDNKLYYTLGYAYGDGSFNRKYPRLDITFCTDESKKCTKYLYPDFSITEKDSRGFTRAYSKNNELFRNRNKIDFPNDIYNATIEQKVAFIAGLFDSDGNYFAPQHKIRLSSKNKDFLHNVRRLLESIGILSGISSGGISTYGKKMGYLLYINAEYVNRFVDLIPTIRIRPEKYEKSRKSKIKVKEIEDAGFSDVFCCDVGVDEHSFQAEGIIISNCTEIVSEDDCDVCVLGSINLAKIDDIFELKEITDIGILFLLIGTEYTDRPLDKIKIVQEKNRRLGLGLMGLHEWLIKRGYKYEENAELGQWLDVWKYQANNSSEYWADYFGWNTPIKNRAIAPNGTISIVGGQTSSGIEPIFSVAYRRRYLSPNGWQYQYVIDSTAEKLIENGVDPNNIEDAYSLSLDVERRIKFQVFVQNYVDNGISSTVNLPKYGTLGNDDYKAFGKMLYKYLPKLRGITCYADGSRNGQPLEVVDYNFAKENQNKTFETNEDCKEGICGL